MERDALVMAIGTAVGHGFSVPIPPTAPNNARNHPPKAR